MKIPLVIVLVLRDVMGVVNQADTKTRSLSDIAKGLKTAPNGILHVADDGIFRSFDEVGNVLDYSRLSSMHLMMIADWCSSGEREHLRNVWENVDSCQVEEDEIWKPPEHLLPAHLSKLPAAGKSEPKIIHPQLSPIPCAERECTGHSMCRDHGCNFCVGYDKTYRHTCSI